MKFEGKEQRPNAQTKRGKGITKQYLKYRCPRPMCDALVVYFLDISGYNNPYIHLRRCYGRGLKKADQENILVEKI